MSRDCLVCGERNGHEHHTLPKSVWPQHRDNPNVFIPLCFICHMAWHEEAGNVPWDMLPARTRALIESSASREWIERWYPARPEPDLPF